MIAIILVTLVRGRGGAYGENLPASACPADHIEVVAWARHLSQPFDITNTLHNVLEDKQAR